MDLNNIQLFVEVVKRNSFAEVARIRNIDPSSVSRAIRKLETTLGFRLFQRTTRKLSPTEAGKSYFRAADFGTSAWLVYPSGEYMPLKLSAFIDCLKNEVPEFS